MAIQPVEFCQKNNMNYCESNIIKYVCRHKAKAGKLDLEKVIHYAELLIEMEYPEETACACNWVSGDMCDICREYREHSERMP